MRRLTRRGRLVVTLVTVAVLTAGALTWGSRSPGFIAACVFCACIIAIGLALLIDDFDHSRHRRVVVGGRRRWE